MTSAFIKTVSLLPLLTAAAVMVGCGSSGWSGPELDLTKSRAEDIAAAALRFEESTGQLPANLRDLVPEYIDRINRPVVGLQDWEWSSDHDSPYIGFADEGDYPICIYNLRTGDWFCDM